MKEFALAWIWNRTERIFCESQVDVFASAVNALIILRLIEMAQTESIGEKMRSKKMEAALNKQINKELQSAYEYLAMAAEADRLRLPGFVNWFKMQYQEELAHADRFFNYVLERDGEVVLDTLARPVLENETPLSLFEKALAHEEHITQCIFDLKDLARAESDYATDVFLEWFVNEQVEEEANARRVLDRSKTIHSRYHQSFLTGR